MHCMEIEVLTLCSYVTLFLATLAAAMIGNQQFHNNHYKYMFCEETDDILDDVMSLMYK